ncbi:hypothetical protein KIH39_12340 [Telmatocola sphagniphila]|uniref:Uncharacterized protein n=1 Tax=Telmatocola sphagniphila TaxID=1123043 RepID=A0A8E6F0C7_9BACT|nr:hypothetical protein [Telmatocola sphagniphila]QVL34658.1 hypothetical protein KIH39_12340 [Telmatocola sphagniphila]
MTTQTRLAVLSITGALYLGALLMPVTTAQGVGLNGAQLFNRGWSAVLSGHYLHSPTALAIITWLAHPFLWLGYGFVASGNMRAAALCGGISLVCSFCLLPQYALFPLRYIGFWLLSGSAGLLWFFHCVIRDLVPPRQNGSWENLENAWATSMSFTKFDNR